MEEPIEIKAEKEEREFKIKQAMKLPKVAEAIEKLVKAVEEKTGEKIKSVYISPSINPGLIKE